MENNLLRQVQSSLIVAAAVLLSVGKALNLDAGKKGNPFDWDRVPLNTWVRLQTTGEVPRKVFHGASALAADRHSVFFFGADTHYEDYDNGVFRLDLRSLQWSRDYDADPIENYRITPSGYAHTLSNRPWAMHTFDCWDYDPVTRKLVVVSSPDHAYQALTFFQGQGVLRGRTKPATWFYDPDDKIWELVDTNSPRLFAGALVWDPVGQQLIGHDGEKTYHFDSLHRKWQSYNAASASGWHHKMVFDSFAGRVLALGHSGGSDILYSYDPKEHGWEVVKVSDKPLPGNGAALAYDTEHHVMLYVANDSEDQYSNLSGRSVTFLYNSQTQTWSRFSGESPELYGMNYLTQYDPVRKVFLHFEKARDSRGHLAVWAFRYQP